MQYEKLFRTQSVWKSIFSLAVPSVIIILVMILYNMTDMFFMGQLGDTRQVAAVSVVGPLFSLSAAVATMLGSGGCVLIAKALGSDHIQEAKAYASLCFWGAIGFGIVIGVVLLSAGKAILPVLGATEEILPYAGIYLYVCALGVPFMLASTTLGTIIRAEGAVKEGIVGNIVATFVSVIHFSLWNGSCRRGSGNSNRKSRGNIVLCLFYEKKGGCTEYEYSLGGEKPQRIVFRSFSGNAQCTQQYIVRICLYIFQQAA